MDPNNSQTCKNCGNHFNGKFCNACGEKVYGPGDKSILHLLEEGVHFLFHFEGKLLLTLKTMFAQPGRFSLDYCNGIRKKYFKPISLFLLIVVLYLLLTFSKALNQNLGDHTRSWYGRQARQTALNYMTKHGIDEGELVARYSARSETVSKVLLFLLIPVMAGFCAVFTIRQNKTFFDHLIFSVEANSFFVLFGFIMVRLLLKLLGFLITIPEEIDVYTVPVIVTASLWYIFIAARRFYAFSNTAAVIFAVLFMTILALFVHYIYAWILFFVTMNLLP